MRRLDFSHTARTSLERPQRAPERSPGGDRGGSGRGDGAPRLGAVGRSRATLGRTCVRILMHCQHVAGTGRECARGRRYQISRSVARRGEAMRVARDVGKRTAGFASAASVLGAFGSGAFGSGAVRLQATRWPSRRAHHGMMHTRRRWPISSFESGSAPLAIAPRLARKIHNLHARVATASPAPRQRATLGENPRASLIHTHSQRHTGERLAHATVPRSIALDASRLLANGPSTHLADRPTRPCLLLKCPRVRSGWLEDFVRGGLLTRTGSRSPVCF